MRRYAGTNLSRGRAIDGRAKPVNQRFYYRERERTRGELGRRRRRAER